MGPSIGGMSWREEAVTWHIACSGLTLLLQGVQMKRITFGGDAGELTELLA